MQKFYTLKKFQFNSTFNSKTENSYLNTTFCVHMILCAKKSSGCIKGFTSSSFKLEVHFSIKMIRKYLMTGCPVNPLRVSPLLERTHEFSPWPLDPPPAYHKKNK